MSGAALNRGSSKQDYATPPEFIEAVVKRFGRISYDLAASPENTKSEHYFSEAQNSLAQDWHSLSDGVANLWLNPPFDNISPWALKCAEEGQRGARILFLTPASIGANWFAKHVHNKALVLALNGRICFDGKNPYPKDCILSCYGFGVTGFNVWGWDQ